MAGLKYIVRVDSLLSKIFQQTEAHLSQFQVGVLRRRVFYIIVSLNLVSDVKFVV